MLNRLLIRKNRVWVGHLTIRGFELDIIQIQNDAYDILAASANIGTAAAHPTLKRSLPIGGGSMGRKAGRLSKR